MYLTLCVTASYIPYTVCKRVVCPIHCVQTRRVSHTLCANASCVQCTVFNNIVSLPCTTTSSRTLCTFCYVSVTTAVVRQCISTPSSTDVCTKTTTAAGKVNTCTCSTADCNTDTYEDYEEGIVIVSVFALVVFVTVIASWF